MAQLYSLASVGVTAVTVFVSEDIFLFNENCVTILFMVFLSQLSSSSSHRMSPLKSSPLLEVFSLLLPWSQLRPSISRASGLLWYFIYEATRHHKRHFFQCITSGFLCSISCRSSSSGLPPNSLGKSLLLASLRTWSYESGNMRALLKPMCFCLWPNQ